MHVRIDLDQESICERPQSLVEPRASTHRKLRIPRKNIESPGHLSDGLSVVLHGAQESKEPPQARQTIHPLGAPKVQHTVSRDIASTGAPEPPPLDEIVQHLPGFETGIDPFGEHLDRVPAAQWQRLGISKRIEICGI